MFSGDQLATIAVPAPGSVTNVSVCHGICDRFSRYALRRETVHHLDDQRPIERTGEGPGVREAKPGERLRGVPRVHTRKTSSPITGIQWNRTLKSTRLLSLSYWTNASRLVRVF